MLKIGDKIKYVKANLLIEMPLGTIMTVTDIKGIAVAVEANYKVGNCNAVIQGVMSYDEVEKYFEKVSDENIQKQKTAWTQWQPLGKLNTNTFLCNERACASCPYYYLCDPSINIEYKTDNHKIMLKTKIANKDLKAHSTCHRTDTFDLDTGLSVALARLNVKVAQEYLQSVIKEIG